MFVNKTYLIIFPLKIFLSLNMSNEKKWINGKEMAWDVFMPHECKLCKRTVKAWYKHASSDMHRKKWFEAKTHKKLTKMEYLAMKLASDAESEATMKRIQLELMNS